MDVKWLQHGRDVARSLNRRIILTIPSVLQRGQSFDLRVSATGSDALPLDGFDGELVFADSVGIEGLPGAARFDPAEGGHLRLTGLRAAGEVFAEVRAELDGVAIRSNPAWILDDPPYRLFWGDLHIHTEYSNCMAWSCRDPEFGYAFARDVTHLDFAAAADHLRGIAWDSRRWPRLQQLVRDYDAPGEFVPILAFESSHKRGFGGDNNAYFLHADAPYFWLDRDDMRGGSPEVTLGQLWEFLDAAGEAYFTVPHHSARAGKWRRFAAGEAYDPQREWLFEIYSGWGSSEQPDTPFTMHAGNADGPSYFHDTLRAGCRYGVIASSDDHTTLPGAESRNWGDPQGRSALSGFHHMGLAAVWAEELTREGLWQAFGARRTYGTTLARTILDARIGELRAGQAGQIDPGDPLASRREVIVRLAVDTQRAVDVTLLCNGRPVAREKVPREHGLAEITLVDDRPLAEAVVRKAPFHPEPFAAYTVRVETDRHDTQWSSPIWLDA